MAALHTWRLGFRRLYATLKVMAGIALLQVVPQASAQPSTQPEPEVYQLSGMVLETEDGQPVTFTRIAVKNARRGIYSNETGFYSLPVTPTDTLLVSRIGYSDRTVAVADILAANGDRGTDDAGRLYLYSILFLEAVPTASQGMTVRPYRNAHEVRLAFQNIPLADEQPVELAANDIRVDPMANAVEGLPVDPNDPLAVQNSRYLSYYSYRNARAYAPTVSNQTVTRLIQYIGNRDDQERERVNTYWPGTE